jgi:hypothetical protein
MAVTLLVGVGAAGCGYALAGRGNTLPASIKIIGIPLSSTTRRRGHRPVLTQAVREESATTAAYTINPTSTGRTPR